MNIYVEVDEKPENWKNFLQHDRILYSVFVLGIFYVVYAIVKVFFDVLDKGSSIIFSIFTSVQRVPYSRKVWQGEGLANLANHQ